MDTTPPEPSGAADWRWHRLIGSPLRAGLATGALVLAASSAIWAVALGRAALAGGPDAPTVSAAAGHALLMSLGVFPPFFAGFLSTQGAKWLGLPPLRAAPVVRLLALHLAGCVLLGTALAAGPGTGPAPAAGAGAALVAGAWTAVIARLAWHGRAATRSRGHALALALCALAGAALMAAGCWALWTRGWTAVAPLARAAVWGFVAATFVVAGQRMVPFLSAAPHGIARRAAHGALPAVLLAACGVQSAAALGLGFTAGAALCLAAGAALLALAIAWVMVQSLRAALLRMLFAGFVWLGLALTLAGAQGLWPGLTIGSAALHALTMGFMGSTMLALLSRVAAGETGVHVVADRPLRVLFRLLQLAVATRLGAALAAAPAPAAATALAAVAATVWAAVWLAWLLRYGALLGRTRRLAR